MFANKTYTMVEHTAGCITQDGDDCCTAHSFTNILAGKTMIAAPHTPGCRAKDGDDCCAAYAFGKI